VMTPEDIDRTAVLPLSYVSLINIHRKRFIFFFFSSDTLVKCAFFRDFPQWPIKKPTFECANNPEQIIPYFLAAFCNNLNCITGFCTTHRESMSDFLILMAKVF
jgi:hypothetical protein